VTTCPPPSPATYRPPPPRPRGRPCPAPPTSATPPQRRPCPSHRRPSWWTRGRWAPAGWARCDGCATRCSAGRWCSSPSSPPSPTTPPPAPGSRPRPGAPPACNIPGSCRSTRWVPSPMVASRTPCRRSGAAACSGRYTPTTTACPAPGPCAGCSTPSAGCARPSASPTTRGWCTATSSPPTSWWENTARSPSWTGASPLPTPRPGATGAPRSRWSPAGSPRSGARWAHPGTWPPSRPPTPRWGPPPTCTPWG